MLFTWRHMCKFACPFQRPKDAFLGKEVSPQHFGKTGQILAASRQEPLFLLFLQAGIEVSHRCNDSRAKLFSQERFLFLYSPICPFSPQVLLYHTNPPRTSESFMIICFSIHHERKRRRSQVQDAMRQQSFESLTVVYK